MKRGPGWWDRGGRKTQSQIKPRSARAALGSGASVQVMVHFHPAVGDSGQRCGQQGMDVVVVVVHEACVGGAFLLFLFSLVFQAGMCLDTVSMLTGR